MAGFGADAEINRRKLRHCSRIMRLRARVNHGSRQGAYVAMMMQKFVRPCDHKVLAFGFFAVLSSVPELMHESNVWM